MIQKLSPFVLTLLLLTGCNSVGQKRFGEMITEKVKARAAYDFDCPIGNIKVNMIDNKNFGATGCNHRGTFTVHPAECTPVIMTEEGVDKYCQIVRN
ncbi:hypothetical protein [Leptospira meyeri]|uniref:hypothetical protein n=1 Tax=Leptospira meyeri TaxID=29508 RepID=UPI0010834081|nr:hypothetical protein [Leptospira meyeri]TGL11320.1 hypothetical protein EHQ50_14705 [Leptospira meyeri]